jgi:hypothetical protein
VDCGRAVTEKIEVHAKEFVLGAAGDRHFSEVAFEHTDDVGDDAWFDVGDFCVVHIPHDGALGAVNNGVSDTEVVRVNGKTIFFQVFGKKVRTRACR